MTWNDLFVSGAREKRGSIRRVPMQYVSRFGKPMILLPREPALAVRALTLYPAQSLLGRTAKRFFRAALLLRLPFFPRHTGLPVEEGTPFARFITQTAGMEAFPRLAILAGNSNTRGRRFILLLFNEQDAPCGVVKAGKGEDAGRLIEREQAFFEAAAKGGRNLFFQSLSGAFCDDSLRAIAMPFIEGEAPSQTDWLGVEKVLTSWLNPVETVALHAIPSWQKLAAAMRGKPAAEALIRSLAQREVHPTIFHGDFAPWNVRADATAAWTVLDWERGELLGIPGWDWFHWLIHVSILVLRQNTRESFAWIQSAMKAAPFQAYSRAAGIDGIETQLLACYLFYLHEFIVPKIIKNRIAELCGAVLSRQAENQPTV